MDILDQIIAFDDGPKKPKREWSSFQERIFEEIKSSNENLLIQAVAGSGKTTTLEEAINFAKGKSLFMAFNKSIAEELRSRVTRSDVKTLNALGHRLWVSYRPEAELNSRKIGEILAKLLDKESLKEFGYTLSRVVGIAKNNALGINEAPPTALDFENLIDAYQFDIPLDRLNQFSEVCRTALWLSLSDEKTFDFDDQLYGPIYHGWDYPFYDNVFIDEAQDLSPIQHLMLEKMSEQGSRIIAVGDTFQAIYGFRGALSNSMELLKQRFNMVELPLSITYRCPLKVVEEAKLFCPHIQPRAEAPEGLVSLNDEDPKLFDSRTLVICRNNAPMFKAILRHLRAQRPCVVKSNFIESFQGFINSFKAKKSTELMVKLDKWHLDEVEAAERKGYRSKVAFLNDKYETLKMFAEEYSSTYEISAAIRALGNGQSGPIFSTIHKAKGLEAENVYILRPDLMPSAYALTPEAKQQEKNMQYVGITRAQSSLTYGEILS